MHKRLSLDQILIVILAAVVLIGLVGAFIGLDVSSLWADELFTFWVVGDDHSAAAALARAQSDVHPPFYYMIVFFTSELFGRTPIVLRSFSAVCGVSAVVLFYYATRKTFSVTARLVAMTVTVSSWFWVGQTQDARSYGLCLLIVTGIYGAALALLARERDRRSSGVALSGMIALMVFGSGVHPYMPFIALATLAALMVLVPRLRWVFLLVGASIVGLWLAYLKFVIRPNAVFSMDHSWISNTAVWYKTQLLTAWQASFSTKPTIIIFLICLVSVVAVSIKQRFRFALSQFGEQYLCLMVIPIVFIEGWSSSVILSPNFTSRNFLVCSPFIWGATAFVFDLGVARLGTIGRTAVSITIGMLALISVENIRARQVAMRTPFRESAHLIDLHTECRGKTIAYIITRGTYINAIEAERHGAYEYGYYLRDINLRPLYLDDILEGRAKIDPSCEVVAWAAHYVLDKATAESTRVGLEKTLHRAIALTTVPIPGRLNTDNSAYIFLTR